MMPVDRFAWKRQIGLSNFVNAYYQLRDLMSLPGARRVLLVGPGQGLDTAVMRSRGFDVVTVDVDPAFGPDLLCSVHDMTPIGDLEFDVAVVSHVLEHLPPHLLDQALREIARVARYALVYLPVNGLSVQVAIRSGLPGRDLSWIIDFRKWWKQPSPDIPRFMQGQHYWEVGVKGYSVREVKARLSAPFELIRCYRNHDWRPSMNFVLKSRRDVRVSVVLSPS
jgi:SAM-dependent methyltransferase